MTGSDDSENDIGSLEPFGGEVPSINANSVDITQSIRIPPDFEGELEGAVPIKELEQLADEISQKATEASEEGCFEYSWGLSEANDEYSELIDEYRSGDNGD